MPATWNRTRQVKAWKPPYLESGERKEESVAVTQRTTFHFCMYVLGCGGHFQQSWNSSDTAASYFEHQKVNTVKEERRGCEARGTIEQPFFFFVLCAANGDGSGRGARRI